MFLTKKITPLLFTALKAVNGTTNNQYWLLLHFFQHNLWLWVTHQRANSWPSPTVLSGCTAGANPTSLCCMLKYIPLPYACLRSYFPVPRSTAPPTWNMTAAQSSFIWVVLWKLRFAFSAMFLRRTATSNLARRPLTWSMECAKIHLMSWHSRIMLLYCLA